VHARKSTREPPPVDIRDLIHAWATFLRDVPAEWTKDGEEARRLDSEQNPFSVLRNTQYRLLFAGTTLAMLAFGMMQVAQGVVAFELTGKNSAVGFVFLGQGI
jgi:hypothetical protein